MYWEWFMSIVTEHGSFANIVSVVSALIALLAYNSAKHSAESSAIQAIEAARQNNFSVIQSRVEIYKKIREHGLSIASCDQNTASLDDARQFQSYIHLVGLYFDSETYNPLVDLEEKANNIFLLARQLNYESDVSVLHELQHELDAMEEVFADELKIALANLSKNLKIKFE